MQLNIALIDRTQIHGLRNRHTTGGSPHHHRRSGRAMMATTEGLTIGITP